MKTKLTSLILLLTSFAAYADDTSKQINSCLQVILQVSYKDTTPIHNQPHRTPPVIPEVYLDNEHSILLFGMPCFESTIQLIIPGTDTPVYTYVMPDGDTEVQLPTSLSGEYELHIHRGNYCFNGIIEL